MSIFRAVKNYGSEGWQFLEAKGETVLDAVTAREDALANMGGGEVIIVEVLDVFDAYRRAEYDRDALERQSRASV